MDQGVCHCQSLRDLQLQYPGMVMKHPTSIPWHSYEASQTAMPGHEPSEVCANCAPFSSTLNGSVNSSMGRTVMEVAVVSPGFVKGMGGTSISIFN